MTISPDDVRRLLDATDPDSVLVLIEGRTEVIPAAALDSDDLRGAMTVTSRQKLIDQIGSPEPSAQEVAAQEGILDAAISTLGG